MDLLHFYMIMIISNRLLTRYLVVSSYCEGSRQITPEHSSSLKWSIRRSVFTMGAKAKEWLGL